MSHAGILKKTTHAEECVQGKELCEVALGEGLGEVHIDLPECHPPHLKGQKNGGIFKL